MQLRLFELLIPTIRLIRVIRGLFSSSLKHWCLFVSIRGYTEPA
jgi:hypothetical protein